MQQGTDPVGAIRCLACGKQYEKAPMGWDCSDCGGPVSQKAGTIVVTLTNRPDGTTDGG